nr:hypothetical protein [Mesorhizobium sp. dw_380]
MRSENKNPAACGTARGEEGGDALSERHGLSFPGALPADLLGLLAVAEQQLVPDLLPGRAHCAVEVVPGFNWGLLIGESAFFNALKNTLFIQVIHAGKKIDRRGPDLTRHAGRLSSTFHVGVSARGITMNERYSAIIRRLGSAALSTTTRRWTAGGLLIGLLAVFFIPAMGLAVAGTAIAIWAWVAGGVVFTGGLIGNALGANKQNRALRKEKAQ